LGDSQIYSQLNTRYLMLTIRDPYGRSVTQARISLNSSMECNFSCDFCHKEGIKEASNGIIRAEEVERITRILTNFGISIIKLTGGEPLLRKDIVEIVGRINKLGVKEISLSTNGTHLSRLASKLKDNGLKRVNVSLHTLNREKFKILTGTNRLNETIESIKKSIDAGLLPVKMNTTVMRGLNDGEIDKLIEFSRRIGGSKTNVLQLIELVPNESLFYEKYSISLDSIENDLRNRAIASTERISHRRPKYELENGVTVEIVRPMHNTKFCIGCNRMRITYDGKFKSCLLQNNNHIDFLSSMRSGADDAKITEIFKKAISIREPFFKIENKKLTDTRHKPIK